MRRRDFIKVIAGSAVAWPLAVRAQQPGRVYRIGFITAGVPIPALRRAFYDALRMLGWIESKNFVIEERYSENRLDRLPALVAELVRLNVDAAKCGMDDAAVTNGGGRQRKITQPLLDDRQPLWQASNSKSQLRLTPGLVELVDKQAFPQTARQS